MSRQHQNAVGSCRLVDRPFPAGWGIVTLHPNVQGVECVIENGQFCWELLFAASVLTTLLMILLFLVALRQYIEGIATTGLKGYLDGQWSLDEQLVVERPFLRMGCQPRNAGS